MNLDWTCNKCLKVFPKMTISFFNTFKGFRFCEKCFDPLKSIDEKLTIDWQIFIPREENLTEVCDCNCCGH